MHKWPTIFNFLVLEQNFFLEQNFCFCTSGLPFLIFWCQNSFFFRAEFISAQMTCHFLFSGDRTYFFWSRILFMHKCYARFFFFQEMAWIFFLHTWPVIFCAIFNIPDLLCIINKIIESKG